MCIKWRRRRNGPRRANTLPILNNPHLKNMLVDLSTIINPTNNHTHKPNIHVTDTDLDGGPEAFYADVRLSLAMQQKIEHIFNSLCGSRSRLHRDKFAEFLTKVQGEQLHHLDKRHYEFREFLEVWMLAYGADGARKLKPSEKDLSKPITNYFISSSHNTYMAGNQIVSTSNAGNYTTALLRGCRCIEIDVWNGDTWANLSPDSPRPDQGPFPGHKRGVSGESLPNVAQSVIDVVEEKLSLKMLGERPSRSPRSSNGWLGTPSGDASPRDSTASLDPREKADHCDSPRQRSRSRSSYARSEPIVTHGWALVAPCGFRDVCKAIRESAFFNNDLPIIVSLEVHADIEQQEVMVSIMKEEWAGLLLDRPFDGYDPRFRVPSLGELKRKILVKVKKAPPNQYVFGMTARLPSASPISPISPVISPFTLSPAFNLPDDDASASEDERAPPTPHSLRSPSSLRPKKKRTICPSLSSLSVYTHSEHFDKLESAVSKKPAHIYSVDENTLMDLYQTRAVELFTHNKNYFMRVFPHKLRFMSTNHDPSTCWRKGVQMVALNWQCLDEGMMLNEGMFADEQGWVLKPPGYRAGDKTATCSKDAEPTVNMDLKITILAGQHVYSRDDTSARDLRPSELRPIVKCEIHIEKQKDRGPEGGTLSREVECKLKTKSSETDHPDFGDEGCTLQFQNISKVVEQLSFIRFKVEDASTLRRGELLAWACIRLDRLRQGYRFIGLIDPSGHPIVGGNLLVKIEKTLR